ncbi:ATP-binding protein [Streptomyces sp. NPDC006393]|uniref:ATP-binding protein n=1 Tax=Streptomyces sp. NPDC006393 TaxID=3156763 RepID=UPI0033D0EFCE
MRHLAQQIFSAHPQTVRAARDFAVQALDSWGGCRRDDDIRLCVSELAGNAVQHGSPDGRTYLVRLVRHQYCLHVEVHDSARHFAVRIPPASPNAEAGRGMHIVQELCDDWGVQALTGKGKAVWTCFRRPEAHTSRCSCTP